MDYKVMHRNLKPHTLTIYVRKVGNCIREP